uniref:Rhomboid domain-containing protein n=1 Tax=Macrostomum lignano TaxID=282301 RepID=A0A1I8FKZ7_9PLAT
EAVAARLTEAAARWPRSVQANAHCISVALSNSAGSTMSSGFRQSRMYFSTNVLSGWLYKTASGRLVISIIRIDRQIDGAAESECAIVSRLRCQQLRGFYHPDSQLCSQVNCLADACGMLGFSNLQQPNQFYRLATSQFLHAGLATLLALGTPGWLEADSLSVLWLRPVRLPAVRHRLARSCGCWTCGCSGWLAGSVLVEYITAWPYVESRVKSTALLLLCLLILLLLGVSPWLDLFSSVGGFVAAVCCALPACCPHLRLLYCCGDASFEDEVDGDNIDEEEEAASAAVVEDNADEL